MNEPVFRGKLSNSQRHQFVYCSKCREFWVNDLDIYGTMNCPNMCGYCLVKVPYRSKEHDKLAEQAERQHV